MKQNPFGNPQIVRAENMRLKHIFCKRMSAGVTPGFHGAGRRWPLALQISISIVSGGMLILAYPPYGLWPCVILSWSGLMSLVFHGSKRTCFYLGLAFGLVAFGGCLAWLRNIFGMAAVPLYGILSLFIAVSSLMANILCDRCELPCARAILAASIFATFEFIRCEQYFLEFPWISAGSALGVTWVTPIIGVYGTSFIIFTAAALLVIGATRPAGIILAVCLIGCGFFKPPIIEPTAGGETIRVAVVQGEELHFSQYIEWTLTTLDESPKLVIWPEYALPYDVRQKQPGQMAELQQIAQAHDLVFVLGTKTTIGAGEREWRNTALTIGGNGVLGEYYKNHTVHFFDDGIAGTNAVPVDTPIGRVGTAVCFDCDYEDITRELVRRGAEFIVAPTFDAIHWSETQHKQHAVFFQLRAAENGRWLVCSASSGYSRIIDPHGHIHKSMPFAENGAFVGVIVPMTGRTFYNRAGWMFPWAVMAVAIVLGTRAVFCGAAKADGSPSVEPTSDDPNSGIPDGQS